MEFYPQITNTCHDCGQPCQGVYAPNLDAAIAGGGKCAGCAGVKEAEAQAAGPTAKPKRSKGGK